MVVSTYADATGNWMLQSDTIQVDKVAADDIPKGRLLFLDSTTDKYKQTANGSELGPFKVSVDPAPATTLKVHVADDSSEVYLETQGALEPNCELQPGTRPGTVAQYVEPAVGGSFSQAELTAVRNARRRIVGIYRGKTNNNVRDGGVCPPAVDTDLVLVKLHGGKGL